MISSHTHLGPDAAGVVLTACSEAQSQAGGSTGGRSCSLSVCVSTCDDGVALVVESAGEDLVPVALQHLHTDSRVDVPKTGRPVRAGREEPSSLWTEAHLQGAAAGNRFC